jgi:hypothetical protein
MQETRPDPADTADMTSADMTFFVLLKTRHFYFALTILG